MTQATRNQPQPTLLPALAVATIVLAWAASFPAIGQALRDIDPMPLASVRFGLAATAALVLLGIRRPRGLTLRDAGTLAVCGLLGIAGYNLLLNSGQATVSAGAAAFIVNTQPLIMALLAVLVLGEAFNRWAWAGTALGLSGAAVIAAGQPGGLAPGAGATLILAAAACAAGYSVLQRPLFARAAPFDVTLWVVLAGAVALLPWLAEGVAQTRAAGWATVLAVLFLAFVPGLLAQVCWAYAIRSFGAARAGQFLYLVPPVSITLAWVWLDEVPAATTLAGGALALAGVILVNSRGRGRPN